MMTRNYVFLANLALGCALCAVAQEPNAPTSPTPSAVQSAAPQADAKAPSAATAASTAATMDASQEPVDKNAAAPVYVPSLDGSGTIKVGLDEHEAASQDARDAAATANGRVPRIPRNFLLYGASLSGGWSSGGQTDAQTGASSVLSSHVGVLGNFRRGGYVLQYASTVTMAKDLNFEPLAFHRFSGMLNGAFSRRLGWNLSASTAYGDQTARLLGPLNVSQVGEVAAADTSSSLIASENTRQLISQVSAGLSWQRSRSQDLSFSVHGSYASITASSNVAQFAGGTAGTTLGGFALAFNQVLTPRTALNTYASFDQFFGPAGCSTVGGGIGLSVQATRRIAVAFGGGPQVGLGNCAQTSFNAFGRISSPLHSNPEIYVQGGRTLSNVWGTGNRFDDQIGLGLIKHFRRSEMGAESGYTRSEAAGAIPALDGYYAGAHYSRALSRTFSLSVSYRRFASTAASGPQLGNTAMVALVWQPNSVAVGGR